MGIYLSPLQRIIRFIIKSFYLESGFLNLGSTAKCVEATFLPATLNFTAPINAYLSGRMTPLEGNAGIDPANLEADTPFYGEVLNDGQNSKTVVGTLASEITDYCGNTYTYTDAIYGELETYVRKVTQRYVPSSMYSGKLRLWVQAIYGSMRKDYSIYLDSNNLPDSSYYKLILGDYTFEYGLPTAGLLTTDNYEYYLMEVSVTSVTFKKLKLSTESQDWANELSLHPNKASRAFSSRVEAYILSQASIDPDFTPVVSSTGITAAGSPMGYGFKFNWKGSQAKIVLHELDAGGFGINASRTVTLNITDTLTVTGIVSGAKYWSNGDRFQFLVPDFYNLKLLDFGEVAVGTQNTTDCPMYGYYLNDQWHEFQISSNISTQSVNEVRPAMTNANFPGYGTDAPEGDGVNGEYFSGSNVTYGSTGYKVGNDVSTFKRSSAATRVVLENARIWTNSPASDPLIGYEYQSIPYGSPRYPSENYQTRTKGFIFSYLQTAWPYPGDSYNSIQAIGYWKLNAQSNLAFGIKGGSNSIPSYYNIETWYQRISGGGLHNDKTVYTDYGVSPEITLAIPLFDAEAMVFGHRKTESWSQKQNSLSSHYIRLSTLGATLVHLNCRYAYLNRGYTPDSFSYLDVKQSCTNSPQSDDTLSNITYDGPGGKTDSILKYACSGSGGFTEYLNDGYTIKSEQTANASFPAWTNKYFVAHSEPTLIAKSSANGANILIHAEGDGNNENGYPPGVFNAVGWA